jgi:hypothetical protein
LFTQLDMSPSRDPDRVKSNNLWVSHQSMFDFAQEWKSAFTGRELW